MLAVMVWVCLLAGVCAKPQEPPSKMYESKSLIRISKNNDDRLYDDKHSDTPFDAVFIRSEVAIIPSPVILDSVITKLGLQKEWGKRLFSGVEMSLEKARNLLVSRIAVIQKNNSYIVEIAARSEVPKEAADIANAIVSTYIERRRVEQQERQDRTFKVLDDEIAKQAEVVKRAKDCAEKICSESKLSCAVGQSEDQPLEQEWKRKSAVLDDARADLSARQARVDQLSKLSDKEFLESTQAMGIEDANTTSLLTKKQTAESDLAQMRASGLDASHPRIKSKEAELAKINEQLKAIALGKRRALEIDLQAIKARVEALEKEVTTMAETIRQRKTTDLSKYREAIKVRDREQLICEQLVIRKKQMMVDKAIISEPVAIISRAEPSEIALPQSISPKTGAKND